MENDFAIIDHFRPLLLNIGHATHHADWNWSDVVSPFMRIFYVIDGYAQLLLPNQVVDLVPGRMYFINSFTRHSYRCNGHFQLYYLHVFEDASTHESLLDNYDLPVSIPTCQMDRLLIESLLAMNPTMELPASNPQAYDNKSTLRGSIIRNKQRALSTRIESRGILYQLLARFLQNAKAKGLTVDPRIGQCLAYINANLNTPIYIEQLADKAGLCRDHLSRLFRVELGESPMQYVARRKIERAQLLLITDTDLPVKSVALSVGYEDYSYFIRMFRKIVGLTPQQYRQQSQ